MQKRTLIVILGLALGIAAFLTGVCEASPTASGYVTGDDFVWIYGYDGNGNWGGTNWWEKTSDDWWVAQNIFGNPSMGQTVDLYFAVKNMQEIIPDTPYLHLPGELNPAGFIASISTSSGSFKETGTDTLLSDTTHWEIVAHPGWIGDPTFDPTGLSGWGSPTSYGANNSSVLWNSVNGGPVVNINDNAQWLWTDNNFNPDMDNYVVFHTRITVTPEPTSLILFGIGGLAMAFIKRKQKI